MKKTTVLTGITTTGTPHLGNYIGAIKPAIASSHQSNNQSYYFLADYHALVKGRDANKIRQSSLEIAAVWLALGLDTDKNCFYRQSDVPEIVELMWIISCMTAKGLMNRAHAYKSVVQENKLSGQTDPDYGISMGLFSYPVLMAADILMFKADQVPVGQDQIQHIEMTRDIAKRMNHHYNTQFIEPTAIVNNTISVIKGLDGRKMSKSYNNTIPLFASEKQLLKLIKKIKTNSLEPGEPKDTQECTLFQIYSAFSTEEEQLAKKNQYASGASWGSLKNELFEFLNEKLSDARKKYNEFVLAPDYIESELQKGANKARQEATSFLSEIKTAVGLTKFFN